MSVLTVRGPLLCLCLALPAVGDAAFAAEPVTIHVENDTGVAALAVPVTWGLPLPKGYLRDSDRLQLQDGSGDPSVGRRTGWLPLQVQVTARWADGSIKWLLLDTQVDLDGRTRQALTLVPVPSGAHRPPPASPLEVRSTAETITVRTGPLRFVFDRRRPVLVRQIDLDLNDDGRFAADERILGPQLAADSFVRYRIEREVPGGVTGDQVRWPQRVSRLVRLEQRHAVREHRVSIESAGPLRAVIRVEGEHAVAGFGGDSFALVRSLPVPGPLRETIVRAAPFVARFEFYAGKPYVRVYHSLVYTGDGHEELLRDAVVSLRFDLGGKARAGGAAALARGNVPWRRLRIVSLAHDRVEVRADGETLARQEAGLPEQVDLGVPADRGGVIYLRGPRASVLCVQRDFGAMHPAELEADGSTNTARLAVHLWPTHARRLLDVRRYSDRLFTGHGHEERPFAAGRSAQGMSFTREYVLDFSASPRSPAARKRAAQVAAKRARLHLRRPFVHADGAHYAASGVWGPFAPEQLGRGEFPRTEALLRLLNEIQMRARRAETWYGVLDYGDVQLIAAEGRWAMSGRRGWANGAGFTADAALGMFLRTGRRSAFDHFDAMIRHLRDVDTVHVAGGRGGRWRNSADIVGSVHAPGRQHGSGYAGDVAHTAAAGKRLIDHYWLTGDRRSLDVARLAARFAARGRQGRATFIGSAYRLAEACASLTELAQEAEEYRALAREGIAEFEPKRYLYPAYDALVLPGLAYVLTDGGDSAARARAKLRAYIAHRAGRSLWTAQADVWALLQAGETVPYKSLREHLRRIVPRRPLPRHLPAQPGALISLLGENYPEQVNQSALILWQVPFLMEAVRRRGERESDLLENPVQRGVGP